ncbi:hypothetical protein BDV32DRAFT_115456 [Aspergillus pseudonomiae]|uniref:Uncharacterized protein n=1 Tax=Aspergillus pseudonomiae TaxID=1506151 RepID=A0A5N6IMG1_9EURO|nr:uncharacterized protein BDV37DRAFT_247478 [Aspergillus pseudonomiae]KAB8266333.1 hypothetical protein BDV32DRAFT_115456 [Aspergillus pseudonomiae]KAE8404489.1 hypothetical protein BDV37DRAFT_247478 [Aspergillus pseudonomiae]
MLLTLQPSSQNGIKGPHDYAIVRQSIPTPRSSPPSAPDPAAAIVASKRPSVDHSMESSRGGLPPPSTLALPPPDIGFSSMNSVNQPLPRPPAQRQSTDDTSQYWHAKAEEDRRRQEEERTRQESLRLEQRKIEQSMLRDSLQAGVPPHMIPLIFAGISQNGVPQAVIEWTQQHMTQAPAGPRAPPPSAPALSHSSHSSHRRSLHARGESRSIPPGPYAAPPPQQVVPPPGILLSQPLPPSGPPPAPQPLGRSPLPNGPADPRGPPMPRPNPGEPLAQQQPTINLSNVHYAPGSSIPHAQHVGSKPDGHHRQSPSLYFHHWVPPSQSQPNTPSGRIRQESPFASQASRRPEYQSPPGRKRKATGPHQPAPFPSSRPSETIPGASQVSRPGSPLGPVPHVEPSVHSRQHSGVSVMYEPRGLGPSGFERGSRAASPAHHTQRVIGPTDDPGLRKDYDRVDVPERRGEPAPTGSNVQYPPAAPQLQYSSSIGTAPPDSDLDSSPGPSPTSGIPRAPTRPGDHGAAPPR